MADSKSSARWYEAENTLALRMGELEFLASQLRLQQLGLARSGIRAKLGAPGTYEQSYEDYLATKAGRKAGRAATNYWGNEGATGSLFSAAGSAYDTFRRKKYAEQIGAEERLGAHAAALAGTVPDAGKFVKGLMGTREGRLMSYLTAQADQLVRREGRLYEEYHEDVLGPIYQEAAQANKEAQLEIERNMARGGSARRAGLAQAQMFRAQDDINRRKVEALWTSNLALNQYFTDNARAQVAFNEAWITATTQDLMVEQFNGLSQFYNETMVPTALNANRQNAALASIQDKDSKIFQKVLGGLMIVAGAAAAYWTKGTSLAMVGPGAQLLTDSGGGEMPSFNITIPGQPEKTSAPTGREDTPTTRTSGVQWSTGRGFNPTTGEFDWSTPTITGGGLWG